MAVIYRYCIFGGNLTEHEHYKNKKWRNGFVSIIFVSIGFYLLIYS